MEDKYKRVARYAKSLIKEVETIAHSVGVTEPRQFRRHHVRLMQDNGRSELMSDLYPVCLLSWSAAMRAIFSPGSINRPTIAMALIAGIYSNKPSPPSPLRPQICAPEWYRIPPLSGTMALTR